MPTFNIEDLKSIKKYVKSLDRYNGFDEIVVNHLYQYTAINRRPKGIEIKIFVDDLIVYTLVKKRSFTNLTVALDYYFEKEMKILSAATRFGRELLEEVEDLDSFLIVDNDADYSKFVIADTSDLRYCLHVKLSFNEVAIASVTIQDRSNRENFEICQEFNTKHTIRIDELKDVLERFRSMRDEGYRS